MKSKKIQKTPKKSYKYGKSSLFTLHHQHICFKMSNLYKPISIGSIPLQQRLVLAPLTRVRADPGNTPSALQQEYYAQRSSTPGTLLISEATYISPGSAGAPIPGDGIVPGIWSDKQISAWKQVFKKVHDNGSFIFLQLWDIGRVAWASELEKLGDYVPYGPSAIPQKGDEQSTVTALSRDQIAQKIALYVQAAKNAIEAGADGVEIHGATGYLPDTFVRSKSNIRTDEYGGSVENRSRFILELVDAVSEAVGAHRTALRLSPWSEYQDIFVDEEETPVQFSHVISELEKRAKNGKQLAYLNLVEARGDFRDTNIPVWQDNNIFRKIWTGNLIRAGGYTKETAEKDADAAENTLIAFGRHFLANPDLIQRFKTGGALNKYDRATFYVPGEKGYIDYPTLK